MKRSKTIFGREPAAWIGLIEAALAFLVAVLLHWSQTQVGLVMAVVVAGFSLYTAWVTNDTMLAVVVGLVKALLALFAGFGLTLLTPEQAGLLIALVTAGLGFWNRSQTFPVYSPPLPADGAIAVSNVGTQ